jgi:membrane protease YdiL (CAAX protease family)
LDLTNLAIAGEIAVNLVGAAILCTLVFRQFVRKQRPATALPDWNLPALDFLLFLVVAVLAAFFIEVATDWGIRRSSADSDMRILISTAAQDAGLLAGAAFFYVMVCKWRPRMPGRLGHAILSGATTFAVSVPVINLVSLVWQAILGWLGVPVQKQDMVELLLNTRSGPALDLLIVLAVLVAPVMEEVLFRASIFRFLRTCLPRLAETLAAESPDKRRWLGPRTARALALLLPAALFGAAHGSLSFFPSLLVLGLIFSLAYERTGTIGTTIVAHALFNLNMIALVLAGVAS